MSNTQVGQFVESLSKLTVLEVSELVKALEEKWGVSAAAPMSVAVASGASAAPAEEKEEQTEFTVAFKDVGANKVPIIKEVRTVTGLGLKEAKDLVEANGKIKEGASKEEAGKLKERFEALGAVVVIS